MNADAQELAHAQSEATDIATAARVNLNRGDELYENLISVIGYGGGDPVLRTWCRAIQKRLEDK